MKECKGCQAYCATRRLKPAFKYFRKDPIKCPCISCLVKPTCKTICYDYHKFEVYRASSMGVKNGLYYRRILHNTNDEPSNIFVSTVSLSSDVLEEIEKNEICKNNRYN